MTKVPPKTTYLRQGAPTIRDVAREANVALGTASRVLTGSPRVKPQTRERVLEVAARLGYRPNPSARALARGKTNTIGVLVPFFFTRQNHVEVVRRAGGNLRVVATWTILVSGWTRRSPH